MLYNKLIHTYKTKKLKKTITLFLLTCFFTIQTISLNTINATPNISAQSAILIEASTGRIIYSKNADEKNYPASTTKIITLIVALENGNLEDIVTVSQKAAFTEGSSLGLDVDEKLPMIDLLYGIMLLSGNDASEAVAEHISGSSEKFAELMNQKAKSLGIKNTHFANPHGLHNDNHYTTATDLARITAYSYKNPLFTHIISTIKRDMPYRPKEGDREIYNKNRLLYYYDGANGVKTGYTDTAGHCLVAGAKQNNLQLISVVFNSETVWEDSEALLNYGFQEIKPYQIFKKEDTVDEIKIFLGSSSNVKVSTTKDIIIPTLTENEKNEISIKKDLPSFMFGSVKKGEKLGTLTITTKNKETITSDLISTEEVKSIFSFGYISDIFSLAFSKITRIFT
ncbi:D-alanyl-D-alanine carboxypeptidase [Selenomonadales bacterium OttesenSCG-928-I06]|nr:D-alanyl-D-alanine carboxypeptidase [Selenomonadales bacterium OttesenSCG-928-I06]